MRQKADQVKDAASGRPLNKTGLTFLCHIMTSDVIRQAFAHPDQRVDIAIADMIPDRLSVRDYVTRTEIGAFQSERGASQRLRFNVVVALTEQFDTGNDDVDGILSYDKLTEAIEDELALGRRDLLETLAENISGRILQQPQASKVILRIEKLDRGPGALGVEILRTRVGLGSGISAIDRSCPMRPQAVVFSRASLGGNNFETWIAAAAAKEARPVIFCAGFDQLPAPIASDENAQRRIDLLSMEQLAWQISAQHPQCVVVDNQTELEWGIRNRQISLWAPSRLVLNIPNAPFPARDNTQMYVQWFANLVRAERIIAVDINVPTGNVPVQRVSSGQRVIL